MLVRFSTGTRIVISVCVILPFSPPGQFDRTEVLRFPGGGGDQRGGGGDGADGARRACPQGPQLEGGQGDDGQGGRLPGVPDHLQQGEDSRHVPEGYPALPAGEHR